MSEESTRLAIAYAFAPYADTSAVAATKRLVADGERVDVIGKAMDDLRPTDPSLAQLADAVVHRQARVRGATMFGSWGSIEVFVREGRARLAAWDQDRGGVPYTSLWSRAHFIASSVLAALVKLERPELHWVAEISDPLSRKATGEPRRGGPPTGPLLEELAGALRSRGAQLPADATTYAWAETVTYLLADEVVFTGPGMLAHCRSLVADPVVAARLDEVARWEPHATLPRRWYTARPDPLTLDEGVVHLGYFGRFYDSQDPSSLLRALALLAPADRERVRLHLFTGQDEALAGLVTGFDVGDAAVVHDRLPFLDFLAAARQMDVLVAVDAAPTTGAAHVRLSKMSDYEGAGTPIWGIVAPGSDLARSTLAHRSPLGHTTAALQVLTRLARQ